MNDDFVSNNLPEKQLPSNPDLQCETDKHSHPSLFTGVPSTLTKWQRSLFSSSLLSWLLAGFWWLDYWLMGIKGACLAPCNSVCRPICTYMWRWPWRHGAAGQQQSPTAPTREPPWTGWGSRLERRTAGQRWWICQNSRAASLPGTSWRTDWQRKKSYGNVRKGHKAKEKCVNVTHSAQSPDSYSLIHRE